MTPGETPTPAPQGDPRLQTPPTSPGGATQQGYPAQHDYVPHGYAVPQGYEVPQQYEVPQGYGTQGYQPQSPGHNPPPPSLGLTITITALFGLFGLIPAASATRRERERGRPTSRYWKAFWATIAASIVLWIGLIVALSAVIANSTPSNTTNNAGEQNPAASQINGNETAAPATSVAPTVNIADERRQALAAKYGTTIAATAAKLDRATVAALVNNPTDQAASVKALSELTGVPVSDVTAVATVDAQHGPALAAAHAVDQATLTRLLINPADTSAQSTAIAEIGNSLGLTPDEAMARLRELAAIPAAQLLLVNQDGPKITAATAQLIQLSKIPAADAIALAGS